MPRPRGIIDGHAPLLSGRDLNAYISCGISSDHECTRLDEAAEKMRLGMHIMIREGTQAKNLRTLIPLVTPGNLLQCSLVTDDLHPYDLLKKGHLNHLVSRAVSEGIDPVSALIMASYSTARYFGLGGTGAIAPGYRADIVVLSSLVPVHVESVIKDGRIVVSGGRPDPSFFPVRDVSLPNTIHLSDFGSESFAIRTHGNSARVIGLVPDQLITLNETAAVTGINGFLQSDPDRDLIKIAVLERHRASGNIGLGLVRGFGLRRGALASSVAHDSHNIICVGCTDADMAAAVRCVQKTGGGLAVAAGGEITASLPLPFAGLISGQSAGEIAAGWESVRLAAGRIGCVLPEPFMALSFLALPVIPELKITDQGLFDVNAFRHVPLFLQD